MTALKPCPNPECERTRYGNAGVHVPCGKSSCTVVDECDVALATEVKCSLDKDGYAVQTLRSGGRAVNRKLHRAILAASGVDIGGLEVDHINGDKRDNRRVNLRAVTRSHNMQNRQKLPTNNSSGHLGVFWNAEKRKWGACITVNGKTINLPRSATLEGAIEIRRAAVAEYYPAAKDVRK